MRDRLNHQDQLIREFREALGITVIYHQGRQRFVFRSRTSDPNLYKTLKNFAWYGNQHNKGKRRKKSKMNGESLPTIRKGTDYR